ncbi:MAG: A/G-specific adenine glycosylase [Azonexus sp.]|nr:A/G-specific adenine glycosylase [Azonexus sp.]
MSKGRIIGAPTADVEADLAITPLFSERLIAWQKVSGRHELPWQKTRDPYRVWLSEIMLQQTQVATVIPYYQRFLDRFPDVTTLAAAPIEAVIEHWAGLGYYARARNLHRCAQQIATVHAGKFPNSTEQLVELAGIGRSTAAAIAAFAFGQRAAILDGNVKRVLCRQYGVEGFPGISAVDRSLWQLAENLLPAGDIEAYTQGLMDLGATLCTRSRPRCDACPVSADCVAFREQRQAELPASRPRPAVPERSATFVLILHGRRLLLERRPPSGIWGGLLVPPEGEPKQVLANLGLYIASERSLPLLKHTFTHFRLTLQPVLCEVTTSEAVAEAGWIWLDLDDASEAGVPTPIRKLIKQVASAMG